MYIYIYKGNRGNRGNRGNHYMMYNDHALSFLAVIAKYKISNSLDMDLDMPWSVLKCLTRSLLLPAHHMMSDLLPIFTNKLVAGAETFYHGNRVWKPMTKWCFIIYHHGSSCFHHVPNIFPITNCNLICKFVVLPWYPPFPRASSSNPSETRAPCWSFSTLRSGRTLKGRKRDSDGTMGPLVYNLVNGWFIG